MADTQKKKWPRGVPRQIEEFASVRRKDFHPHELTGPRKRMLPSAKSKAKESKATTKRKLKPTASSRGLLTGALNRLGAKPFEEFTRQLLERLTGARIFAARSGSQQGRDLASGSDGPRLFAECKCYSKSTLKERDVVGGFVMAAGQEPDLWILAATCEVSDQLDTELRIHAEKYSVDLLILDCSSTAQGWLQVACAAQNQFVNEFMQSHDVQISKNWDEEIRLNSNFSQTLALLQEALASSSIGFGAWRNALNSRLVATLGDRLLADAKFNQPIWTCNNPKFVRREGLMSQMDASGAVSGIETALLGEEGDGKTWIVASWLQQQAITHSNVALILLTSNLVSFAPLPELLSRYTKHLLSDGKPSSFWVGRIARWLEDKGNRFFIAVDGLNETTDVPSRVTLIKNIRAARIPFLISCREKAWRTRFPSISGAANEISITGYDAVELMDALAKEGLVKGDIPKPVLALMRKPRYFRLAIEHRAELAQCGDISVARLIYFDWYDRIRAGKALEGLEFSEQDFKSLMEASARKYRHEPTSSIPVNTVRPAVDDKRVLRALIDEGLSDDSCRVSTVSSEHLAFGLGCLLLEDLRQVSISEEISDRIAVYLEPEPNIDVKAQVLGHACLLAVQEPDVQDNVRFELLSAWCGLQNQDADQGENIFAYLGEMPETYSKLMEQAWLDPKGHASQNRLKIALVRNSQRRDFARGRQRFVEQWLPTVFEHGCFRSYRFGQLGSGKSPDKQREELQQKSELVRQRISESECPDFTRRELPQVRVIPANKSNLLELRTLALYVLAEEPNPELKAKWLYWWALVYAISDGADEEQLVRWILKICDSKTKQVIVEFATAGYSSIEPVQRAAGKLMLNLLETAAARKVLGQEDRVDHNAGFKFNSGMHHVLEPDGEPPSEFEALVGKFRQIDVGQMDNRGGMTSEDYEFERLIPLVARWAPREVEAFIDRYITHSLDREGERLRERLFRLREHQVLLKPEHIAKLNNLWSELDLLPTDTRVVGQWNESILGEVLLAHADHESQVDLLSNRLAESIFDPHSLKHLKSLDQAQVDRMFADLQTASKGRARAITYVLSSCSYQLQDLDLGKKLFELSTDPDTGTATWALRAILNSGSSELMEDFHRLRIDDNVHGLTEKETASRLFVEIADQLSLDDLRDRVSISQLGGIVSVRGNRPEEINVYKERIHSVWRGLVPDENWSSPNGDVVLYDFGWPYPDYLRSPGEDSRGLEFGKEELRLGNPWLAGFWRESDALTVLYCHHKLDVVRWVDTALQNVRLLNRFASLYESLCAVLLAADPLRGVELYAALKKFGSHLSLMDSTDRPLIEHSLFLAPDSAAVNAVREQEYLGCKNDSQLLSLALLCRQEKSKWMAERIQQDLRSKEAVSFARGIFMHSAFADVDPSSVLQWKEFKGDWMGPGRFLLGYWNRRVIMEHWFMRYFRERDELLAWAAYQLLLESVDLRIHSLDLMSRVPPESSRWSHLRCRKERLKKHIKEHHKPIEKTFLGQPVLNHQVWPWLS